MKTRKRKNNANITEHPDNQFNKLSDEIIIKIFSYLSSIELFNVRGVNTHFKNVSDDPALWQEKAIQHFSHKLINLKKQKNLDWHAEFINIAKFEYRILSKKDKHILFSIKENDFEKLRKTKLSLKNLDKKDRHQSFLDWARQVGNQRVLDFFYQMAEKHYLHHDYLLRKKIDTKKKDQYGRTILYWAIACNQDLETIKNLLAQGSQLDEQYKYQRYRPIHMVTKAGQLDKTQFFLEQKPDELNQHDAEGNTPLILAAMKDHLPTVQYLVTQPGIRLNDTSKAKTALHLATELGHSKIVAALIEAGADTILPLGAEEQLIHIAAKRGDLEIVNLLTNATPHLLNQLNKYGKTPLILAISHKHVDVVNYLLGQLKKQLIDLNNGLSNGQTALHLATTYGYSDIVSALIHAGANPYLLDNEKYRPVDLAAKMGNLEIIKILTEQIVNEEQTDDEEQTSHYQSTPFILAVIKNHLPIVEYFLTKKIDINARFHISNSNYLYAKHQNKTAFHLAIELKRHKIFDTLLNAGASTSIPNQQEQKAIHLAAEIGNLKAIEALIKKNPDLLNQKDSINQTPLMWASARGHLPVVKYLLSKENIELNTETYTNNFQHDDAKENGKTALHWAIQFEHIEIVAALVNAGAKITFPVDHRQQHPIHLASKMGMLEIVKILIEKNPDLLNQEDNLQQTPLVWAAVKNKPEIVIYLLNKKDIDLYAATYTSNLLIPSVRHNGKTALHWAAEGGHNTIVSILLKHGIVPNSQHPINKSKLDDKNKAKIELLEYIEQRKHEPRYKKPCTVGSHTLFYWDRYSRTKKVGAATALYQTAILEKPEKQIRKYKKVLNHGKLKPISQKLRQR